MNGGLPSHISHHHLRMLACPCTRPRPPPVFTHRTHRTHGTACISFLCASLTQVSEKLPDQAVLMTPHRYLVDIYSEFIEDLRAADIVDSQICTRAWFCHLFAYHPELRHITIASGKENFGRCDECSKHEQKIADARKQGASIRLRMRLASLRILRIASLRMLCVVSLRALRLAVLRLACTCKYLCVTRPSRHDNLCWYRR